MLLQQNKIQVDAKNVFGFTPLMKAAIQGHTRCAKALLLAGNDINDWLSHSPIFSKYFEFFQVHRQRKRITNVNCVPNNGLNSLVDIPVRKQSANVREVGIPIKKNCRKCPTTRPQWRTKELRWKCVHVPIRPYKQRQRCQQRQL